MRVGHGGFFLVALLGLFASGFLRSDGHGDGVEASSLGQAADDVRALHGLGGRALAQVVDGAHGDQHARGRVHGKADMGVVRAGDRGGLRQGAGVEHVHEGALAVEGAVLIDVEGRVIGRVGRERYVRRGEQPAVQRGEVRREHEAPLARDTEDLLDLGRVAVRAHAIGLQVLVREAEMRARRGLLARARDARDGIDDNGAAWSREAHADCGRRCKRGCCGIAAGAGDERGLAVGASAGCACQIVGKELGQAERRAGQQVACRVGGVVPLLVDGRVLEAEVGREVDDRRAARHETRRHGERRRVRHGQEHELARGERRVVVRGEGEVGGAGEAGVLRVDARARQLVGRGNRELEVGMAQHEAHQLDARKPRRTHDTRLDGHVDPSLACCAGRVVQPAGREATFVHLHKSAPRHHYGSS